jgi:hypothetical protein
MIATTGYILSGQEEILNSELISNYDFSSGETGWTYTNPSTEYNIIADSQLKINMIGSLSPVPGALSTAFSVNNSNRYKLVVDVAYHYGKYLNYSEFLSYQISGESISGVIAGSGIYVTGLVSTNYITFSSAGSKQLNIYGHGYLGLDVDSKINSVSLKEVTQEGITSNTLFVGRSHLIVRCMGETI